MPPYTYVPSLLETITESPTDSIVSKTFVRGEGVKAILFAFAPNQELSEHTASVPAMIQILDGTCTLTLGTDSFEAAPGAWAYMPPNMPHSILAHTPVKMLLLMLSD